MSPIPCSICSSPQRQAIETAMINMSLAKVAGRFKKTKSSVHRHKAHAAMALAKTLEGRELASAANLIQTVQGLIGELQELKRQARRRRDGSEARKTVESILKSVSVLADLSGARAPAVTVNVAVSREDGVREAVELLLLLGTPEQLADLQERYQQRQLDSSGPSPASESHLTQPLVLEADCNSSGINGLEQDKRSADS